MFNRRNAGRAAAWLTICVTLCAGYEGYAAHPYVDTIGTGHPITYCYGETKADGPIPQTPAGGFSEAYCKEELAKKLATVYGPAVDKCIPGMLPHRKAAIADAAYNLGPAAVCKSSIARYLKSGNVAAGCHALLGYVRSAGQVRNGLVRRRQAEYKLCIMDN